MCVFNGRVHVGFAFIVWIMIQIGVEKNGGGFINPIPFLIGSVFPDCDHRRAPMGRLLPLWIIFNHRGFTHSLPACLLFSLPLGYWSWEWAGIFAAGYLLHLLMDSSTPMGIKWVRGHKRKRAYR